MGEWSKKIGEAGESLLGEFFGLIGWDHSQKGIDIDCSKPEKHGGKASNRRTHGIDFLSSFASPLIDGQFQNVLTSMKFTSGPYPPNPNNTFKDYFVDLAGALECFKSSKERLQAYSGREGIRQVIDVGVLFWLTNQPGPQDDLISRVATAQVSTDCVFQAIYVVDNHRIAFIYDSLKYVKARFPIATSREFYYQETGKNLNPMTKVKSGRILPVEFINTSVLAMRVEEKSEVALVISEIDGFSEDGLKRLLGLAQILSGNWAKRIVITFPDYVPLMHHNEVQRVKAAFSDKNTTAALEVACYREDFRSLQKG